MHSTSLNCFLKPFTWIFMAYHYINIHQIDVQIICQNNISIQWSKLWAWPKRVLPGRSFDLQILRCGCFGWFHLDLLVQSEAIPHSVPVHP